MADGVVPVVFALPETVGVFENFAFRPICPCEAADHSHLVFAIYSDGIVRGRSRQPVTPDAFASVEIGSGVDGNVVTIHPQIHVELVSVGGAGGEVGAAQDGARVGVAEDVGAALGE